MRCLTLAEQLARRGAQTTFICQQLNGEMSATITERGHACELLAPTIASNCAVEQPADRADLATDANATAGFLRRAPADWLIVDHYQLCHPWYQTVRPYCGKILVIDDLANRYHDCDLLHDQTLGRTASDYRSQVNAQCQLLLGPRYALLRPEFARLRQQQPNKRRRNGSIVQLLIALGGSDQRNTALTLLQHLETQLLQHDISVILVAGVQYAHIKSVTAWASRSALKLEIHHAVTNIAELMQRADIAIGASGGSAWERCCLGLPTLACVYAENQKTIAAHLQSAGASRLWHSIDELQQQLGDLLNHPEQLTAMSSAAAAVCDGAGTQRVVDAMESM